jgi:beta-lactamase regulating signal transducer with metallopeptidase domain
MLQDNGVEFIQIFNQQDSKYHTLSNIVPVSSLTPMSSNSSVSPNSSSTSSVPAGSSFPSSQNMITTSSPSSSSTVSTVSTPAAQANNTLSIGWIVLLIIVGVVLLGIIIYLYNKGRLFS